VEHGRLLLRLLCWLVRCLRSRAPCTEIAVAAQGHALFTRAAGSNIPCPQIDFDNGWNEYFAAVYKLPANETVKSKFGAAFGAQQRSRVGSPP